MRYYLIFAVIALLFFVPFIGNVHLFDWDEINFAECAREMIALGDYLKIHMDFLPFNEKPPLFFWLQALSMHAFGVNEFAARFPNAICGVLVLVLLFHLGKLLFDQSMGVIWAMVYFGSILPHFYFKSGIIDPYFNLFIFLGLLYTILFYWKKYGYSNLPVRSHHYVFLLWGAFFIGLAVLTKGFAAYIIFGLCLAVYWVYLRFRFYINPFEVFFFTLAVIGVISVWFGTETYLNGSQFVIDFTVRQWELFSTHDAGFEGFFGYHFVVLLVGCFPASVFALAELLGKTSCKENYQENFRLWMVILLWVVLILFSIVRTKIVHYSSLAYFPISFLAALQLRQMLERRGGLVRWQGITLRFLAVLLALLPAVLPLAALKVEQLKPLFAADPFAQANLEAQVNWTGAESLVGLYFVGLMFWAVGAFKYSFWRGLLLMFGGTALFVQLILWFFIAKIEKYSQNAAVEFAKSLQGKHCYVVTMDYKSYVHHFYTAKQPNAKALYPQDWKWATYLLENKTDRDVYFMAKINTQEKLLNRPNLRKLYEKNGFVFYLKKAGE